MEIKMALGSQSRPTLTASSLTLRAGRACTVGRARRGDYLIAICVEGWPQGQNAPLTDLDNQIHPNLPHYCASLGWLRYPTWHHVPVPGLNQAVCTQCRIGVFVQMYNVAVIPGAWVLDGGLRRRGYGMGH
jgi:hypothetical protein